MRYLLDTDWAIEYLRENRRFVDRIGALSPQGIGISIISLAELYEGVAAAQDRQQSERELWMLIDRLTLLDLDPDITRLFGIERLRLRREGNPIGDMDLLIGVTALHHDLTVLTNNRRHFDRIPTLAVESI